MGTGEQMGLSFAIKVPNLELLEADATAVETETPETHHDVQETANTTEYNNAQTESNTNLEDYPRTGAVSNGDDPPNAAVENPVTNRYEFPMDKTDRRASAPTGVFKPRRCSQIEKLREDNDSLGSSDSLYYDANEDLSFASGFLTDVLRNDKNTLRETDDEMNTDELGSLSEQATNMVEFQANSLNATDISTASNCSHFNESAEHNHFNSPHTNTTNDTNYQNTEFPVTQIPPADLQQEGSDDSGYEMAEEMPRFYYHDARIRCFVLGEHRIFELYVDGSMIQEHTKHIQCDDLKNDMAKKMD